MNTNEWDQQVKVDGENQSLGIYALQSRSMQTETWYVGWAGETKQETPLADHTEN